MYILLYLDPYLKLVLFSGSGRLVKKKKSAVKWATKGRSRKNCTPTPPPYTFD